MAPSSPREPKYKRDITPKDPLFDDPRPDDLIIPIMGLTGAGKSTFINKFCCEEIMKVNHGLESCTRQMAFHIIWLPEDHPALPKRRLVLVDTPGFDDTTESEHEILRRICIWLADTYDSGTKVTGLVYLHSVGQPRMTRSAKLSYDLFHAICGENAFSKVVMATTQWDTTLRNPEAGEFREKDLKTKWWKEPLAQGALYKRIEEPEEDIKSAIEHLLEGHAVATQVQKELVEEDKRVEATEAGKKLSATLQSWSRNPNIQDLSPEKEEELKDSGFPVDGPFLDRVKSIFRRNKGRTSSGYVPSKIHD
ncbi:hypothetical protein EST38_g4905 [Candolleomyces aberdarensis]|uniref:G domain-containing protein n=1 Tax=Candolleomyces aberdarensis TaxID=2316362 RepID=A0A4Q2DLV6_9AGAR|nr:hypothetical protein EST38_g4905 [Candolleomyces aberdarensis]